jgi:hypothetical protein
MQLNIVFTYCFKYCCISECRFFFVLCTELTSSRSRVRSQVKCLTQVGVVGFIKDS